jgi:plasmid stabilization system protein ParE
MVFEVVTTPEAEDDALKILDWLMAQHAGDTGRRWFFNMDEAIRSLADMPQRCKVAPESASAPYEIRELHYGRRPHVYRILFTIEDRTVTVLNIMHGRRKPLTPWPLQ